MLLSPQDIKTIADRLLSQSRADGCELVLRGGREQSLRFAQGAATTNRTVEQFALRVSSHVEGRVGSVDLPHES